MARESVCNKKPDVEANTVVFKFAHGVTEEIRASDFNEQMQQHLLLNGISQKLGDAFSGSGGDSQLAHEKFTKVKDQLLQGLWISRVAGSGSPRVTLLAEAISRIANCTIEEAKEKIDGMDEDQQKAIRSHAKIKLEMQAIKTERLQAKADEDDTPLEF